MPPNFVISLAIWRVFRGLMLEMEAEICEKWQQNENSPQTVFGLRGRIG